MRKVCSPDLVEWGRSSVVERLVRNEKVGVRLPSAPPLPRPPGQAFRICWCICRVRRLQSPTKDTMPPHLVLWISLRLLQTEPAFRSPGRATAGPQLTAGHPGLHANRPDAVTPSALPIREIHSQIVHILRTRGDWCSWLRQARARLPRSINAVEAGLAGGKEIVVLQPRRVAARTVAARVAWERQCPSRSGGRLPRFVSMIKPASAPASATSRRILLRWLQRRRTLSNVGAVLFDEFHEGATC